MPIFRAACSAACLVFPTASMAQSDDPPFTVTGKVVLASQYRFGALSPSDERDIVDSAVVGTLAASF